MSSPLRVSLGALAVLCLSLVALAETSPANKSRRAGITKHAVAGNGVHLHHHQLISGNHTSAGQLRGIHSIGALQSKKTANIHLNVNNGRFHLTANGSRQGIRSMSLRTTKGRKEDHGRPHPSAGIFLTSRVSTDLPDEATEATEFISLQNTDGEYSFTQAGGNIVTIVMMFQIGNTNGQPVFATATFQMDLQRFLQLIGGQQNPNPTNPLPNPLPNPTNPTNPTNPLPNPDPNPLPTPDPDPVPDPVPDPTPQA